MSFNSSRGVRRRRSVIWSSFLILSAAVMVSAQAPETVLATVNKIEITQQQVDDSIASQIYPLQQQLYAIRKAALENLITTKLLESEAAARHISLEELRRQLTVGEINVTRAHVEDAYKQNASFFAMMSPDEARERLRLDLENQARMKHYRAGLDALRKKWAITMNLSPPVFVSELDDGVSPVKGPANAAVTIVEFSDFECPFCKQVQNALKQVVESFGKEVRLVFKHLPLEGHRNSLPAARAAYCAAEQDRFWQFHDALFAAGNLSPPVLEQIASDLGLGLPKFQACIAAERSRAAVVKDIEAARLLRIESTPSFVVNGKVIKGALSFAGFQKIIEQELGERVTQKQPSIN
ncbi:MAG TPA: thioredoxin domain-containing protein [Pyrinomonadaceae bacterium]|nr:thioredoxin domain-containing protein [Pyrinomonadaceae bacterium]